MTQSIDRPQVKTEALSYADRITIASVLTWNEIGSYTYSPDEVEAIRIVEDMVSVKLTGGRSEIISRFMFRSILEALRSAATKQIDSIIQAESAEVAEAEREMSEIIHATAQDEIAETPGLSFKYDWQISPEHEWLTEPIGADPGYIFGMTGEQQAEILPPVENAYHDPNWTSEGCEF